MDIKKNKKADKYADYRYEIVTPEELREAKYLISLGLFDDMADYIECTTRAEIRIMKREDAKKKKRNEARKKKRVEARKQKLADIKETRKAA